MMANGLTSDGNGHLYLAAANSLNEYFIVSDAVQVLRNPRNRTAIPGRLDSVIYSYTAQYTR